MFKEGMKAAELVAIGKDRGWTTDETVENYKKWQIAEGITEAPIVTPSVSLGKILGTEDPVKEAVLKVIEKALPLLDKNETLKQGSDIILKAYDSLAGNKNSSINVINNNSTTTNLLAALKQEREEYLQEKNKELEDGKV